VFYTHRSVPCVHNMHSTAVINQFRHVPCVLIGRYSGTRFPDAGVLEFHMFISIFYTNKVFFTDFFSFFNWSNIRGTV
jgi:hypothetical protein